VTSGIVVVPGAILLVFLAGGGWAAYSRRRLRAPFGTEVDKVTEAQDGPRAVDRELRRRKNLNDGLLLRTISASDHDSYARSWEQVQDEFTERPASALSSAEGLVARLLDARGYPGVGAEDQLELLSVEHPGALADYRWAQQVGSRARVDPGAAEAEELRRALASCHVVVAELLTDPDPSRTR
jgi:hypothetical protein